ncbi:unnamed protein product [Caenorhabditis angaria]|uniref:Uncharacterized protein n=1 Tax=Caenorhabditis angaria TaxID=860376 RepID=A0A9P1IDA1_9PELO|nr:unnamed protein product [Caenorhabditis angaria]
MNSCVTLEQKEVLQSISYELVVGFNFSLTAISFLFTTIAIIKLLSQSIIQSSTKIFLLSSLFYVFVQNIAYGKLKINMIWDLLFKMNDSCYPYYKITDCLFILKGLMMASCGLMVNQSFMSLDRIFHLISPGFYKDLRTIPAWIAVIVTFFVSFFTFEILTIGDPLEGQVLTCAYFPRKSAKHYELFLSTIFYLSIAHFIIDTIIFKLVLMRKQKVNSFNMLEKYHAKESLKSIQYVVLISSVQFLAQVLSSWCVSVFLNVGTFLSSSYYAITSSLTYSLPYFCVIHPILIIWMLRRTRIERQQSIQKMRSQRETQDEHMSRMTDAWA